MKFSAKQWRVFCRIQRKYPVSLNFLKSNLNNIRKFIWLATYPRATIRSVARRKYRTQRIVINYRHLQRVQWDLSERNMIKKRKKSVQQWSKRMVSYLRSTRGVHEYVEDLEKPTLPPEEVSKQLKEQLQILKSGKRTVDFISSSTATAPDGNKTNENTQTTCSKKEEEKMQEKESNPPSNTQEDRSSTKSAASGLTQADAVVSEIKIPEKPNDGIQSITKMFHNEKTDIQSHDRPKSHKVNFLDMLMSKVGVSSSVIGTNGESAQSAIAPSCKRTENIAHEQEHFTDSSDEFLGFDETDHVPGMLLTPLVPQRENAAFISESLNAFMRENALETTCDSTEADAMENCGFKFREANLDGLVTPTCTPPQLDMPVVPESLQKLRTVAERRHYLQKFAKNHKLAIINNEATIYRELQRKLRLHKSKSVSQQLLQASNSQMPFTRKGWLAASFVCTEYNKYYYQMLEVDGGRHRQRECLKLRGVRGNNDEQFKRAYCNFVPPLHKQHTCCEYCADRLIWRDFKPIKTCTNKSKLNKATMPRGLFRPCPLSRKPYQKPLDEESAALLLTGGSMAIVRMPIVELEVFPELGRPLHELAKRYLQYILPHEEITGEWAEFSVSTLQQPLKSPRDDTRTSFMFPIPYLNDRNHILVRRVIDRSEKLDQSFTQMEADDNDDTMKPVTAPVADLSFRAGLDEHDVVLKECADVVSDMINCVAISCSENSFIKEDPDGVYASKRAKETVKPQVTCEKAPIKDTGLAKGQIKTMTSNEAVLQKRKNCLLLELKRLNATIIDAAAKTEKGSRPCNKEYCTLGCVCTSLADEVPLRQHCGKSKCVIECTCKGSTQSRVMRLETDGRSITTEDAFILRRQATARLARMEKEFTSTVVLTENETLLINESQYDKKRRCTKVPKRYEDFADTDEDLSRNTSPVKSSNSSVLAIDATTDAAANNVNFAETTTELREPIYVQDTTLSELKHCSVPLIRLADTKNMVAWCMVHELYKCFCDGRATEGKPLHIEKEEVNDPVLQSAAGEQVFVPLPAKARYSFEKIEEIVDQKGVSAVKADVCDKDQFKGKFEEVYFNEQEGVAETLYGADESELSSSEEEAFDAKTGCEVVMQRKKGRPPKRDGRGRPSEDTIIKAFYNAAPLKCRRAVPVPKKCYLRMNRKRKANVLELIEHQEDEDTRLLLNEHILRSVYYHKHELERRRREELLQQVNAVKSPIKPKEVELNKVTKKEPEVPVPQKRKSDGARIGTPRQSVSSNSSVSIALPEKRKSPQKPKDSLQKEKIPTVEIQEGPEQKRVKLEPIKSSKCLADTVVVDLTEATNENTALVSMDVSVQQTSHSPLPRTTQTTQEPTGAHTEHIAAQPTAADFSLGECSVFTNEGFKLFYNGIIRNMNSLVSKKMQDIDVAMKRDNKLIPTPNEEILCIMKWTNFLDAYVEGYVFIWEVKMPQQQNFLAATVKNMMPLVVGALGVINMAALDVAQLPLMGRMLQQRIRTPQTQNLAIVMQGRATYWLVRGFLRPDQASACAKPTPQTHPSLTKKINLLCSVLVKQRIKDYKRKLSTEQRPNSEQPKQQNLLREATNRLVEGASAQGTKQIVASKQMKLEKHTEQQEKLPQQNKVSATSISAPSAETAECGEVNSNTKSSSTLFTPDAPTPTPATTNKMLLRQLGDASQEHSRLMQTNISFRKVRMNDIDEIHPPEFHTEDHRWLVLDLCKDFSHIYVPEFRDLVSLDRIHKVMLLCKQKKKIVKLQFFQNAPFDAFVTPSSTRKIYFGPLELKGQPPLLILLQSVDGQMMLREMYQREHKIPHRADKCTTAFWILQLKGQIHFEIETKPTAAEAIEMGASELNIAEIEVNETNALPSSETEEPSESDDDCMIVESSEGEEQQEHNSSEAGRSQQAMVSENTGQMPHGSGEANVPTQQLSPMMTLPQVALQNSVGFVPLFFPPNVSVSVVKENASDVPPPLHIPTPQLPQLPVCAARDAAAETTLTPAMTAPLVSTTSMPRLTPLIVLKRRQTVALDPSGQSPNDKSHESKLPQGAISTIGATRITKILNGAHPKSTHTTTRKNTLSHAAASVDVEANHSSSNPKETEQIAATVGASKNSNRSGHVSTQVVVQSSQHTRSPKHGTKGVIYSSSLKSGRYEKAPARPQSVVPVATSGSTEKVQDNSKRKPAEQTAAADLKTANSANRPSGSIVVKPAAAKKEAPQPPKQSQSAAQSTTLAASLPPNTPQKVPTTAPKQIEVSLPCSINGLPKVATITISPKSKAAIRSSGPPLRKIFMSADALSGSTNFRAVANTSLQFHKHAKDKPALNASSPSTASSINGKTQGAVGSTAQVANKKMVVGKPAAQQQQQQLQQQRHSLPASLKATESVAATTPTCAKPVPGSVKVVKPIINVRPAYGNGSVRVVAGKPKGAQHRTAAPTAAAVPISSTSSNVLAPKTTAPTNVTTVATVTSAAPSAPAAIAKSTNKTPSVISTGDCGLFYCNLPHAPKFVAKRTREFFLLKVPTVGTVQISSLDGVNNYLSRLIAKTMKLGPTLRPEWRFLPKEQFKYMRRKPTEGFVLECPMTNQTAGSTSIAQTIAPVPAASLANISSHPPAAAEAQKRLSSDKYPDKSKIVKKIKLSKSAVNINSAATAAATTPDTILIED